MRSSKMRIYGCKTATPESGVCPIEASLAPWAGQQTSRAKARDFHSVYLPYPQPSGPNDIGLQILWPPRPPYGCLVCDLCSSGGSALSFLSTSSRDNALLRASGSCHQGPQRTFTSQSLPGSLSLTGAAKKGPQKSGPNFFTKPIRLNRSSASPARNSPCQTYGRLTDPSSH